MRNRFTFFVFLFLLMLFLGSPIAFADIAYGGSARSRVNAHGVCYTIHNYNANSLFVPTASAAEWSNFRSYASGVGYEGCTASYASPGVYYFTVPYGVSWLYALVIGGGGGGGSNSGDVSGINSGTGNCIGAGGGGAAPVVDRWLSVSPGQTMTIVVGSGGAGHGGYGAYYPYAGYSGEASYVSGPWDSLISYGGGGGGSGFWGSQKYAGFGAGSGGSSSTGEWGGSGSGSSEYTCLGYDYEYGGCWSYGMEGGYGGGNEWAGGGAPGGSGNYGSGGGGGPISWWCGGYAGSQHVNAGGNGGNGYVYIQWT